MLSLVNNISVVIISKNETRNIKDCILSGMKVSDDIIVVDSRSTDNTVSVAENAGAKVTSIDWKGYGYARNTGAENARYNWILSIDADERIDSEMASALEKIHLQKDHLYGFRRLNHVGLTPIKHGAWNPDIKYRLYNRDTASWNLEPVHEQLEGSPWIQKSVLPGYILHYSYNDPTELKSKLEHYAKLGAEQMLADGISPGIFSALKPAFRFFRSYYLKGGFLDGKLGYKIAKANANAVRVKYRYLRDLTKRG